MTVVVVSSLAAGSSAAADFILITSLRFFMCGYSVDDGCVESDDEALVAGVDDGVVEPTSCAMTSSFVIGSSPFL